MYIYNNRYILYWLESEYTNINYYYINEVIYYKL